MSTIITLLSASLTLASAPTSTTTAPRSTVAGRVGELAFGAPGQLVLGGGLAASVTRELDAATAFAVSPEISWFVAQDLALTAAGELSYLSGDAANVRLVRAGLSAGVRRQLSLIADAGLSLFPGVSLAFAHESFDTPPIQFVDPVGPRLVTIELAYTRNELGARLDVPALWAPVPHVFFGLGPRLDFVFLRSGDGPSLVRLSGVFVVGGWL
ncbi:hypothetical protein L6R52_05895 [Myxococcota bacterium]|nr:hypothetical protein [Myxococcota bacterium]